MKARATISAVAGGLVFLSSFAHAFAGWPALGRGLADGGIEPDLVATLSLGWHFGSLAMAGLGLIVVGLAAARLRGRPSPTWPAAVAGAVYVAFGAGAMILVHANLHLFSFVVLGLLMAAVALDRRA